MRLVAASAQPFVPRPFGVVDKQLEAAPVPHHAEVIEVADKASCERGVLVFDRLVPVAPAPGGHGIDGPCQSRMPSLARRAPASPGGSSPVQRETQEVERPWPFAALLPPRRSFDAPAIFPSRSSSQHGPPLLFRVLCHKFPGVIALIRPSDSQLSFGRRSGSPCARPTFAARASSWPDPTGASFRGPVGVSFRVPRFPVSVKERAGPPSLLGPPLASCRAPRPRRVRPVLALCRSRRCCLHRSVPTGHADCVFRGFTTRGPLLVCLRIADSVTLAVARLTTSLPGSALAGRASHPPEGSPDFKVSLSSFPSGRVFTGRFTEQGW